MKLSTLYLKLIAFKIIQLLRNIAILALGFQVVNCAWFAIEEYSRSKKMVEAWDIALITVYLVGIIVLRACRGILSGRVTEINDDIDHGQKLKNHKRELRKKNEFSLAEKQIKLEVMETESDMAVPRKFNTEKVGKDASAELEKLVGLSSVKNELQKIHAVTQYEKRNGGIKNKTVYHMRFVGNPGCGKTTVARCMASILYNAGIIEKPKLVSVNGNELMGRYLGETAPTVRALFKQASGGLLFIDEAYALTSGPDSNATSYGYEAVNELLTQLEDKRNKVVVIFAGYEAPLNQFFAMNPGLASRVPKTLLFPDYKPSELIEILNVNLDEYGHKLSEDTKETLLQLFAHKIQLCNYHRTPFSNGRYSRNVADALHAQHALNYKENKEIGSKITLKDIDYNSLLSLD